MLTEEEKLFLDDMSENERKFLQIVHDADLRAHLLARLEDQGLLSAFLEAESETNE